VAREADLFLGHPGAAMTNGCRIWITGWRDLDQLHWYFFDPFWLIGIPLKITLRDEYRSPTDHAICRPDWLTCFKWVIRAICRLDWLTSLKQVPRSNTFYIFVFKK
jgi:hypothetical protein